MDYVSKRRFERCRELRESKGLSMAKLAGSAGVGRDPLRTLEEGLAHRPEGDGSEASQREYGGPLEATEVERYADAGDELDGARE